MKGVLDGKVREAVVWEEIGAVLFRSLNVLFMLIVSKD